MEMLSELSFLPAVQMEACSRGYNRSFQGGWPFYLVPIKLQTGNILVLLSKHFENRKSNPPAPAGLLLWAYQRVALTTYTFVTYDWMTKSSIHSI